MLGESYALGSPSSHPCASRFTFTRPDAMFTAIMNLHP
jgi:hypothetical protein